MTERPIIFSTEMVRAILEGRKTQTRRVIKTDAKRIYWNTVVVAGKGGWTDEHGRHVHCPYGKPGDLLWVRETWMPETEQGIHTGGYIYKASDKPEPDGDIPLRWRPSIYMPKKFSRLWLLVKDVRVERVQDIALHLHVAQPAEIKAIKSEGVASGRWDEFAELWNSINAKRGYGWDANPWVWVVEFERVEPLEVEG